MANTATRTDSYRFLVDQQAIWQAEKKAPAFAPRRQQVAAGAVGGVLGGAVGGAIAGRQISGAFFSRLLTPIGEYEISISDVGIAIGHVGVSPCMVRWSKIDAWAVDKDVFMVRDTTGNTAILPRKSLPEDVFDMVVDICESTLKGAQLTTSRNYGRWANLGTGEKVVRGLIYSVGLVVLFCSVLVFTVFGLDGAFS